MRALIVGIDGQDGYYLSRLLLEKGYEVFGAVRKKAFVPNPDDVPDPEAQYHRIYADLNDFSSLLSAVSESRPDEIYNLAGQSEIPLSWKQPLLTAEVNALGVLRLLEAIRVVDPNARFFQASSSEMFGNNEGLPCSEDSPMLPKNLYGASKLFAHNCVSNYRAQYGLFACSGILFNHESPRRGPEFVTRKITRAAAAAASGSRAILYLGNLDAVRDWGCAIDYVRAMWMLLQQDKPQDIVIASGDPHTVRDFADMAYRCAGRPLQWRGHGLEEQANFADTGEPAIRIDPSLVRYPLKDSILSNPKRLYSDFNFLREYGFHDLVELMVKHDRERLNSRE